MIHYVTPQRSDDPASTPVAEPHSPPAAADAPPGPISWELTLRQPVQAMATGPSSWDAVPHPVGPIPEPPVAASPKPRTIAAVPKSADGGGSADLEPEPLAAMAVHSLGPVGRRRSPALVFTLALLTLGLQPVAWVKRANREMAQFDPRMTVRPGRSAAALAVAAIAPLVVAAAAGTRVVLDRFGSAPSLPMSAQVTRWFVLAPAAAPLLAVLFPLSLVALTMTLERVRVIEDRAGLDPEMQLSPSGSVGWAALPVVGLAVYVARAQGRINRVWEACSAPRRR